MRLDQFLSARTMYSRRELRQMIQKGKATVDGAVVRKADQHVQPDENTVCLNGRHIPGDQYLYTFGDDADIHTFNMVARMYSPYGQANPGIVGFTATFDVVYK